MDTNVRHSGHEAAAHTPGQRDDAVARAATKGPAEAVALFHLTLAGEDVPNGPKGMSSITDARPIL